MEADCDVRVEQLAKTIDDWDTYCTSQAEDLKWWQEFGEKHPISWKLSTRSSLLPWERGLQRAPERAVARPQLQSRLLARWPRRLLLHRIRKHRTELRELVLSSET